QANESCNLAHKRLRICSEVVIDCDEQLLIRKKLAPLGEMTPVQTGVDQLRIFVQSLRKTPAIHPIGDFQSIQRDGSLDWVTKDSNYFCIGNILRNPLSRFRRSEIRGRDLPDRSRMVARKMPAIPVKSPVEVQVEETRFLRGRRKSGIRL